MAAKEIAVKKYVVRLSADERERLETLVRSSRHNGRTFTGARILLKADAGEGGEAWSDSQIAKALDTSLATIARTRQQLVSPPMMPTACSDHSPLTSQRCCSARSARRWAGVTGSGFIAAPSLACPLAHPRPPWVERRAHRLRRAVLHRSVRPGVRLRRRAVRRP